MRHRIHAVAQRLVSVPRIHLQWNVRSVPQASDLLVHRSKRVISRRLLDELQVHRLCTSLRVSLAELPNVATTETSQAERGIANHTVQRQGRTMFWVGVARRLVHPAIPVPVCCKAAGPQQDLSSRQTSSPLSEDYWCLARARTGRIHYKHVCHS